MHLGDAASLESSQVRLWEGLDVRGEGQSGISFRIPAAVPAGEACPLLLALAGGEPSDETVVWLYAPADRGAVAPGGIAVGCRSREIDPEPRREGGVSGKSAWEGYGQQLRDSRWGTRDPVPCPGPGQRK